MDLSRALHQNDERLLILRIALPSMISMISSSLCALCDALLINRFIPQASSAVSLSLPALTVIQTIGFTLGMGSGSFVSRSLGGGKKDDALHAASTAFFSALGLSVLVCGAGLLFSVPLLRFLGAGESVLPYAALYMRFVLLCGPLLCANLVLSSLLRALGSTLCNMVAFGTGALVCLPLQFLLICRFRAGLWGSGVSMLVREIVTLSLLLFFICRSQRFILPRPGLFTPTLQIWRAIMRSGLPTLIRQGLISLSSALTARVSASFGPAALAGMGLCSQAVTLISSAIIGFGQGFQPVCGYAYGSGSFDLIHRTYRFCMVCLLSALAMIGAAVFFFAPSLLSVLSSVPENALFAQKALRVQSLVFFAQGAVILMNMLTQAMGMTLRASIIASSRQGLILIPLLLLLPRFLGENGLIIAQALSDVLSLVLCYFLSRSCLSSGLTRSSCAPCGYSDAQKALQ